MKAIIKAFSPKKCEKIFNGEMTINVCKIAPKLDPPFKVYVYRTKDKGGKAIINKVLNSVYSGGKVIGEFVCDRVIEYSYQIIACAKFEVNGAYVKDENRYNAGACLSAEEMYVYSNGKPLHGLHITAPKLYDTPKELSEFRKPDEPFHTAEINENGNVVFCDGYKEGERLTRPPRSWFYVKEIEE